MPSFHIDILLGATTGVGRMDIYLEPEYIHVTRELSSHTGIAPRA